jgi:hypothetical protein
MDNLYLPWACEDLKHEYEICMYHEHEIRREIQTKMKQEAGKK